MDLARRKLSDTYRYLLSTGPTPSDQVITLGNGAAVPWQANGIVITGNVSQQIDGNKTFLKNLTIPSTLNFTSNGSFVKVGNHTVTLTTNSSPNITFSSATARTYTIPDPGGDASFVMTSGNQTIGGNKTFNGSIAINGDTNIGLLTTATNLFGTGASINRFGDGATTSNSFGNDVTGTSATNSFGNKSRFNSFGTGAITNDFGTAISGRNNFGNSVSGTSRFNNFGSGLISGAQNHFGPGSKNYFGQNGENYFYSGLFEGTVTMPSSGINFTNNGAIVKAGNYSLGLTTTAGTTGIFPTGNINIAALEGQQTFIGEKTFSSGINITKTSDQLVLGSTQKTTITASIPTAARTYTIPDVGGNASFVMTTGVQTFRSRIGFADGLISQKTSNQIDLRTGDVGSNTISISAPSISGNRTYTLPDVSGDASFIMSTGAQTIGGSKIFTSRPTVNGTGFILSGELLAGSTTPYKLTFGGGIKDQPFTWNGNQDKTVEIDTSIIASLTGNQILNGIKTFNTGIIINNNSNQIQLGSGNRLTITTSQTAAKTYTIPDVGGNADFVMTNGSQDITGIKTFASQLIVTTGSNQLVLRTGSAGTNSFTISAPAISGNRTYTLPDVNGNASFVMTTGTQDIGGPKNFTTRPTVNGVNMLLSGDTSIFTRVEATNLVYNTGEQVISGRKRFRNASIVPYGPFINDVDADFNGLLSSREVYFTDDGSVKSAIEIPSLDLVYETGATNLTPRIGATASFSRSQTNTSGTYLDSDGFIKFTAANQPRFAYEVSKNLFYQSNNISGFTLIPQNKNGFNRLMFELNSEINPFKSNKDAAKIIDITGSGLAEQYFIGRDVVCNSGLSYTLSAFIKPINNNNIVITLANRARAYYNLTNNSISGISGVAISSGIDSSYGNGWSRIWLSTLYNTGTAIQSNGIFSSNSVGATGKIITTETDAFYLWGPQLEESSTLTSYELSYGNFSSSYKSIVSPKGLLLEPNSQNLILNSNLFSGVNAGGAITGSLQLTGGVWPHDSGSLVSGSILIESNTTAIQGIYRDPVVSINNGTNYISSIFLRQPESGRRYVLGRFHTSGCIPDTRVVIDLDSGISGGRVISVPGYTTPTAFTGIRYPNNWYRLIISQRATGTTGQGGSFFIHPTTGFGVDVAAYSGINRPSFQIFGHQIETGFSGDIGLSYKHTIGASSSSLGRDNLSIIGSDFNSFYNQNQGTFFFKGQSLRNNSSTNKSLEAFAISTTNETSGSFEFSKSGNNFMFDFYSGMSSLSPEARFLKSTGILNTSMIASYKENNFNVSFYNEAVQRDTTGKLNQSPMSKIVFGGSDSSNSPLYLQRFSYWPVQLQNNKLTGIYRY